MKIENIKGMVKLIADNGKCLIRKGEEQKLEDNEVQIVYLAKSLKPDDYEEVDIATDKKVDDEENKGDVSENE